MKGGSLIAVLHKPGFPLWRRIAGQTICRVLGCRWNSLYCWRCWR